MKDKFFKNLLHNAKDYSVLKPGGQLVKGYKPDTVLKRAMSTLLWNVIPEPAERGI